MSTTAKLTFVAACFASGGLIAYVHYSQAADRERLHDGVRRDVERQRLKGLSEATGSETTVIETTAGSGGTLQR
ncbi:uncharacterized protein LOC131209549 [Anopheles bellator]|uniref:uncharacterized protein LOC131209549 n=1 Tax=Anopheles bellator TaxID=139047 RepID=UPI0026496FC4|nr:uncharacterized protein LOC131209549 [Anopheles bellator]